MLLGGPDHVLQRLIDVRIGRIVQRTIPGTNRFHDFGQLGLVRLGPGNDGRDLLLLDDLPVDEGFDIGMVHVDDDHLGCPPRGAAGFDGPGRPVADLEKTHQAG